MTLPELMHLENPSASIPDVSAVWIAALTTTVAAILVVFVTFVRRGKYRLESGGSPKYAHLNRDDIASPAAHIVRHWLNEARALRGARHAAPATRASHTEALLAAIGDTSSAGGGDCQSDGVSMSDADSIWDVAARRFEVSLKRADASTDWGLTWNVGARARRRLVLASVSSGSPAGLWSKEQGDARLPSLRRGDKLVSTNGLAGRSAIEHELAMATTVQLCFLRLEVSPPAGGEDGSVVQIGKQSLPTLISNPRDMMGCRVKNSFIEFGATSCEEDSQEDRHAHSDPGPTGATPQLRRPSLEKISVMSPVESETSDCESRITLTDERAASPTGSPVARVVTPPLSPLASPAGSVPPTPDASVGLRASPLHSPVLDPSLASGHAHLYHLPSNQPLSTSPFGMLPLSLPTVVPPATLPLPCGQWDQLQQSQHQDASRQALVGHTGSYDNAPAGAPLDLNAIAGQAMLDFAMGLIGKTCWISGLINSPQFNGKWCLVDDYDADIHRFTVRVLSESETEVPVVAKVRAENLMILPEPPPLPSHVYGAGVDLAFSQMASPPELMTAEDIQAQSQQQFGLAWYSQYGVMDSVQWPSNHVADDFANIHMSMPQQGSCLLNYPPEVSAMLNYPPEVSASSRSFQPVAGVAASSASCASHVVAPRSRRKALDKSNVHKTIGDVLESEQGCAHERSCDEPSLEATFTAYSQAIDDSDRNRALRPPEGSRIMHDHHQHWPAVQPQFEPKSSIVKDACHEAKTQRAPQIPGLIRLPPNHMPPIANAACSVADDTAVGATIAATIAESYASQPPSQRKSSKVVRFDDGVNAAPHELGQHSAATRIVTLKILPAGSQEDETALISIGCAEAQPVNATQISLAEPCAADTAETAVSIPDVVENVTGDCDVVRIGADDAEAPTKKRTRQRGRRGKRQGSDAQSSECTSKVEEARDDASEEAVIHASACLESFGSTKELSESSAAKSKAKEPKESDDDVVVNPATNSSDADAVSASDDWRPQLRQPHVRSDGSSDQHAVVSHLSAGTANKAVVVLSKRTSKRKPEPTPIPDPWADDERGLVDMLLRSQASAGAGQGLLETNDAAMVPGEHEQQADEKLDVSTSKSTWRPSLCLS